MLLAVYLINPDGSIDPKPLHKMQFATHIPQKDDFYDIRKEAGSGGIRVRVSAVIYDSIKEGSEQVVNLVCSEVCVFKSGDPGYTL